MRIFDCGYFVVNKLRRSVFLDEKVLVWGFFCGVLGGLWLVLVDILPFL